MSNTLTRVELTDFQSLKTADVELGNFTAIVGPSNLGKSALVRAIRSLVYNAPAPGLVREGATKFIAKASFSDGSSIQLTKGKSVSEYVIQHAGGEAIKHAKAGVKAPEEVTTHWALPDFTITSQHDAPFLLNEPASAVAKRLGELTNAAMLMEAVREANQRRTAALADEKARLRECQETRDELETHRGLTTRTNHVTAARRLLTDAEAAQERADVLAMMLRKRDRATEALIAAQGAQASIPDVSDLLATGENRAKKVLAMEKLLAARAACVQKLTTATAAATSATVARSQAEQEIHNLLSDAGYCPLCRQGVA